MQVHRNKCSSWTDVHVCHGQAKAICLLSKLGAYRLLMKGLRLSKSSQPFTCSTHILPELPMPGCLPSCLGELKSSSSKERAAHQALAAHGLLHISPRKKEDYSTELIPWLGSDRAGT